MRIETGDDKIRLYPETDADRAAIEYVRAHVPLFEVAEQYGLNAFIAGYEAGLKAQRDTPEKGQTRKV